MAASKDPAGGAKPRPDQESSSAPQPCLQADCWSWLAAPCALDRVLLGPSPSAGPSLVASRAWKRLKCRLARGSLPRLLYGALLLIRSQDCNFASTLRFHSSQACVVAGLRARNASLNPPWGRARPRPSKTCAKAGKCVSGPVPLSCWGYPKLP